MRKQNIIKKTKGLVLTLACVFLLAACGSDNAGDTGSSGDQGQLPVINVTTEAETQDPSKKELTFAEIEKLAATAVFNVKWYTTEGDYSAGTSYLIDSEKYGGKLLVTAFHYLWPDNAQTFTGEELPGYVKGGELYYAQSGEDTGARLKCNLVIPDADAVPNIAKDVAAFAIKNGDSLPTLKLSTRKPAPGEKIYLLARLWDGEVINENCVYEAEVVSCGNDEIVYTIDKKYGSTMGASGGPLVDKYGEVVGMHMAGNEAYYFGHVTESFAVQIDGGHLSDVTY